MHRAHEWYECPACGCDPCGVLARCRYPYTHHGPAVFGGKITDYLISEIAMREDMPEMFNDGTKERK